MSFQGNLRQLGGFLLDIFQNEDFGGRFFMKAYKVEGSQNNHWTCTANDSNLVD